MSGHSHLISGYTPIFAFNFRIDIIGRPQEPAPSALPFFSRFKLPLAVAASLAFAFFTAWFSLTRWLPTKPAVALAPQPQTPQITASNNKPPIALETPTAPSIIPHKSLQRAAAPPKAEPPAPTTFSAPTQSPISAPPQIVDKITPTTDATLTGTITDPAGAPIPDAAIALTNTASQLTSHALADPSGQFTFTNIPSGTYQLSASAPGFLTAQTKTTLTPNALLAQNVTLNVAAATSAVEVTAANPTIQTQSSASRFGADLTFRKFAASNPSDGLTTPLKRALAPNPNSPIPAAWLLFFGFNPATTPITPTLLADFQSGLNPRIPATNRLPPTITAILPTPTQISIHFSQPLLTGITPAAAQTAITTALAAAPHANLFNPSSDLPTATATLAAYLNRLPCCANSVIPAHFILTEISTAQIIPTALTISPNALTVTLTPTTPLNYKTKYALQIKKVKSTAGVPLPAPLQLTFTTSDPPAVP